ncbi:cytochrome c oxidase subunit 3 [Hyphomicrobiales bacterium 4NK60-0047b]
MADSHGKHHDYHLVDPSPWPLLGAVAAFVLAYGAIQFMHDKGSTVLAVGFGLVILTMFLWWRDVVKEAEKNGDHTPVVQIHNRYGMILFIASEVMFFVAWFWAFFDISLFPGLGDEVIKTAGGAEAALGQVTRNEVTQGVFPPVGTETFNPWKLPLVNTLILLLSGTTVTWAHHAMLKDDRKGLIWGLLLTVILGVIFTICQVYEYMHAGFAFSNENGGNIYGSVFYMATGFHGFHVVVGTITLAVMMFRAMAGHFTAKQHFGFEAAAWYWHFVDVVWLFLFACIYVWAQGTPGAH